MNDALSELDGKALDSAGAIAASELAVADLLDPLGVAIDRMAGVRPAVPLVRRAGIDDAVWDVTNFTKNRDRVLNEAMAQAFLSALLDDPKVKRGGRNAERDFRGQKRSNETHASTTDPDARLYRKGNARRAGCATWAMC